MIRTPFVYSPLLFTAVVLAVFSGPASAQTVSDRPTPYASIDRNAVGYVGPGREPEHDLTGPEVKIGILVPLRGPRKAEGEALLLAAQLAIEDEAVNALPGGRRLVLATGDESGPWGRISNEIVRLVSEEKAVALITSSDGAAAHLAEQIGNKIGVPVLTLSTDSSTTQINLPWIFRIGPTDTAQARAFAQDIYRQRGCERVLLVTERNHDGRLGGKAFEKAAHDLQAPQPTRVEIPASLLDPERTVAAIIAHNPEAVVFWTDAQSAGKLEKEIRQWKSSMPVYLCRKAAPGALQPESSREARTSPSGGDTWIATSPNNAGTGLRQTFRDRYQARQGTPPRFAAAEAYDAVRLVTAALRRAGANRARLRDQLAATSNFPGVSGNISFDGAGNNRAAVTLVPLP